MPVPDQLVEMDAYITEVGTLTPYDASRFNRVLNSYARYAERYHDPVLAAEVKRLRARVGAAALPLAHPVGPSLQREDLEREAIIVWAQMSVEEQAELFPQYAGQELPVASLTGRELAMVAEYPRSQARREYLWSHRAGMRRVAGYRRWRY